VPTLIYELGIENKIDYRPMPKAVGQPIFKVPMSSYINVGIEVVRVPWTVY